MTTTYPHFPVRKSRSQQRTDLLFRITLASILLAVRAGVVMICMGVLHRDGWETVPALGFGPSVALVLGVSMLQVGGIRPSK